MSIEKQFNQFADLLNKESIARNEFYKHIIIVSTTLLGIVVSLTIILSSQDNPPIFIPWVNMEIMEVLKIAIMLLATTCIFGTISIYNVLYLNSRSRIAFGKKLSQKIREGANSMDWDPITIRLPYIFTFANWWTMISFSISIIILVLISVLI